jgi:hypothetical protein
MGPRLRITAVSHGHQQGIGDELRGHRGSVLHHKAEFHIDSLAKYAAAFLRCHARSATGRLLCVAIV